MKTPKFRVWALGLVTCLVFGAGFEESKAPADSTEVASIAPAEPLVTADAPQLDLADTDVDFAPSLKPASTSAAGTNTVKVVQEPVVPEKLSPALQEIIKLVQAGISEEVIMTYVTNSTNVYHLGSDEIVYLNDLGVSSTVMNALIQQDNTALAREKKHSVVAVKPLPSGVALTTPATNVYRQGQVAVEAPPPMEGELPPAYEEAEPATTAAPQEPVTVNYFYSSLSPYGTWVDVPDYGLCWRPTVAVADPTWRPYSNNGRWLWTDQGWYWYSDYSWGWAPFHYGRWCSYPGYGWVWAPDTYWGPAWVTWRYSKYHCGWAPLPPRCHYVSGFGLYYQNASVGISFGFGLGSHCYTFIPVDRFCDRRPSRYYCNPRDNDRIIRDSVVINNYVSGKNNTVINRGIGVDRIAQNNRGEVPTARVRTASRNGGPANAGREQIESNGSTPVVVAPTLPKVARPYQNGDKSIASRTIATGGGGRNNAAASSLVPGKGDARGPAASVAPKNDAPRIANNVAKGYTGEQRNNNKPETPVVRTQPAPRRAASGQSGVIIAGRNETVTGNSSAQPAGNSKPAPVTSNRPSNRGNEAPAFGPRLNSGNQQGSVSGQNRATPTQPRTMARRDDAVIRGFSPGGNSAPAVTPPASSRSLSSPDYNRPNTARIPGETPRVTRSAPSVSVQRPSAPQVHNFAPAARAYTAPAPSMAPRASAPAPSVSRSAPPSAPRMSAPSPARSSAAPSNGGGGSRGGGGGNGGGGGGGNRGGGRDR